MVKIQFTIEVPIKLQQRKKWVVAACPVLDLHSQGETVQQARKNLGEAITLFLISCFERGTLDDVLKKCGFMPEHQPHKRIQSKNPPELLNIPIPFWINTSSGQRACHA